MLNKLVAIKNEGYILYKKTSADYKTMPWANGSGSTTELYVFPEGSHITDGSAIWRISMARVPESGKFSLLPDYERIITLVEGKGFRLTGNMGTNIEIKPGVFYSFSGAESIECELLGGPCLDLNLMYQRNKRKATMTLLQPATPNHPSIITKSSNEIIILICLEGQVVVDAYEKGENTLSPYNSIYFSSNDDQGKLALKSQAHSKVILIRIENIE